jgi:hypothetical protein
MPRYPYPRSVDCLARMLAAAVLAAPLHASAALLVYEPFDYPAPSLLNGTPARP